MDPAAPIKHGGKRSEGEDAEYPNAVAANVPHAIDKYLFIISLNYIWVKPGAEKTLQKERGALMEQEEIKKQLSVKKKRSIENLNFSKVE